MLALFIGWLLNGVVFLLVTLFLPGVHMARWPTVLRVAAICGFVNSLIIVFASFLNITNQYIFLAIITIIINFLMLNLAVRLVPGFSIRRLNNALIGTTFLSMASFTITTIVKYFI